MELTALRCNNCGAPLEVDEKARFVTCGFCHNQLMITHAGNAIYTEVLDQLAEQSGQMAGNLKVIALQNHLERLDREWEAEKEKYYLAGRQGLRSRPGRGEILMGTIIGGVFAAGWIIFTWQMGAPVLFPLFGLLMLAGIGYHHINAMKKAAGLEQAEASYQRERTALLEKITAAQGPD